MAYNPTGWVNNQVPAINASHLLNLEAGVEALHEKKYFSSNFALLDDALTTIGSTPCTLVINSILLTDSVTITMPSTLVIKVVKGGYISHVNHDLVINGPFKAGLYQCFVGSGNITFGKGSVSKVYLEWVGGKADWNGVTGTDNGVAISKIINAINTNGGCLELVGSYYTTATLVPSSNVTIQGLENGISKIIADNVSAIQVTGTSVTNITVKNLSIEIINAVAIVSGIYFSGINSNESVENITIRNCIINLNGGNSGYCIFVDKCNEIRILDNIAIECGHEDGIGIGEYSKNILVQGNIVRNSAQSGISVYRHTDNVSIINNIIDVYGKIRYAGNGGISSYGPDNYDLLISNNNVLSGPDICGNNDPHNGILIRGAERVTICDNKIRMNSGEIQSGICITSKIFSGVAYANKQVLVCNNSILMEENYDEIICLRGEGGSDESISILDNEIYIDSLLTQTNGLIYVRYGFEQLNFSGNSIIANSSSIHVLAGYFGYPGMNINTIIISDNVAKGFTGSFWGNLTDIVINNISIVHNFFQTTHNSGLFYGYDSLGRAAIINNQFISASSTITSHETGFSLLITDNNLCHNTSTAADTIGPSIVKDIKFESTADADADNDTMYYSSTQSKLVYKDSGGVVRNLW